MLLLKMKLAWCLCSHCPQLKSVQHLHSALSRSNSLNCSELHPPLSTFIALSIITIVVSAQSTSLNGHLHQQRLPPHRPQTRPIPRQCNSFHFLSSHLCHKVAAVDAYKVLWDSQVPCWPSPRSLFDDLHHVTITLTCNHQPCVVWSARMLDHRHPMGDQLGLLLQLMVDVHQLLANILVLLLDLRQR